METLGPPRYISRVLSLLKYPAVLQKAGLQGAFLTGTLTEGGEAR
jgi:hypothetical protein